MRELELSDAVELAKVLSDEISMRHYPHPFSEAEVRQWIERNIGRYREYGFGLWALIRKQDNLFIGDCGITLQNIDGETLPEIGFHVIGEYRGNGYATEAAIACREYAINALKYGAVYSYTRAENSASRKVALKSGMKEIKKYLKDGIEHVVYRYDAL